MPSVFKIYILGISDENMVWRSDEVLKPSDQDSEIIEYGDSILSPKLKKEINKADGFDFMILPSNSFYDSFTKKKTLVFLTRDDKCIFRGRVSDIKTDIFKQRTINCEGDLSFLADSVQSPNKRTDTSNAGDTEKKKRTTKYYAFDGSSDTSDDKIKMSVESYFRGLIGEHNTQIEESYTADPDKPDKSFTVGMVTVRDRDKVEKFERTSFQDTSSIISSDLLSIYGGVLRTRFEDNTAYIDWLDDYTDEIGQDIRFGVNLIEMDQEPPSDGVWSVLLPVGDDNLTILDVNGSMFLSTRELQETYGTIVHYHQFNDVKNATELKAKAEQYLDTHGRIFPDNIVTKAIDLQLIGESDDPLELGEKIKVVSEPHGLEKTMSCIAMELDIYNPENNSYTIGTIMPPDKEKKKDSLSSQQAESSSSHSRGISNNANKIGKLNEDVNVNANNINVNAKNIAVNALNIAVNAENIAIVAKNIAIAADTIDIKTRELSIEFGNKMDDLYGYIHASAEGIKTAFFDNTTGLRSYFSQTAGEISAGVSNAEGTISSKISLTEEHLTSEFNKKIYGENGEGGLVADYSSKITQTARNLTVEFNETLYGANGSLINPTGGLVKDYSSKIDVSAQKLTSEFNQTLTKTLYGENGDIDNAEEGSIVYHYTSKISQEATSIKTYVKGELYGTEGSKENPEPYTIMSEINQNAQKIEQRVVKGEVISSINQTAETIRISASKIDLDGYVTVDDLDATNAQITNLTNGTTVASKIFATDLKTVTGTLDIGDSYNTSAKLKYHGTEFYSVSVSMPNVDSGLVLGSVYKSGNYYSAINLAHSHSVTTNSDGTITLGGTVSTSNPGSFKIADTKTYKDGVSAAETKGKNSVTVSSVTVTDVLAVADSGDGRCDCANIRLKIYLSNGTSKSELIENVPMWKVYNSGAIDAIVKDSYCEEVTIYSDGSGQANIAAYLGPTYDGGGYYTYRHLVRANKATDYHN